MTQNAIFEDMQQRKEHQLETLGWEQDPRKVTFMGNTYDLVSFSALISTGLMLLSCLTCGMGVYCLPIIPLVLGILGVVMAKEAVEEKRTKQWAWIGLGAGAGILIVIALVLIAYFGLLFLLMASAAAQG